MILDGFGGVVVVLRRSCDWGVVVLEEGVDRVDDCWLILFLES